MDNYSTFIHKSRYARWNEEEKRRETWEETVRRYTSYWLKRGQIDQETEQALYESIVTQEDMPSMRALMTAGKALDRDNVAGFNCSYLPIDNPKSFDEMMYILMCGTGVGFSVERDLISKLPEVAESFHETDTVIKVRDSKIGWASAFRELISLLYAGKEPQWDMSKVRPAGAKLKTFGGRSSGPEPLNELFKFAVNLFRKAAGRKLNSVECHDLCCKIADIVVVGGVRRSALISLSNLTDERMRRAKNGQWWEDNPQRALANNSVAYTEKPDFDIFMSEMTSLYESKCGERGVFSRPAAEKIAARNGRRKIVSGFGTNPCSEIILRPYQFCNLSEIVVRVDDTLESLRKKVRTATILGTLQSSLVDFRYLRSIWKQNTEEECLLGVSMTGVMDNPVTSGTATKAQLKKFLGEVTTSSDSYEALAEILEILREEAVNTNKEWAEKLGINPSTAITCVKPSGTVSQLVNSASGMHPRFSEYYIRTVRADVKDPLAMYMREAGFPCEPDVMKKESGLVFSFPIKSPSTSVTVKQVGAMEQLKLWKLYQDHWCEHKPSITVYYKDDEFFDICSWLWKNFDSVSGVSFLPYSEHTYAQAPYQEITKEQYEKALSEMPKDINWLDASAFEATDQTTSSQELACVAGMCEL